jgi:hypothetical protein
MAQYRQGCRADADHRKSDSKTATALIAGTATALAKDTRKRHTRCSTVLRTVLS